MIMDGPTPAGLRRRMMKKVNRWAVLPHLPMTQTLYNVMPAKVRKSRKDFFKSEIASDSLCDDALQRLSPYLLQRPPVDILDLWPGGGLLSSKVNDFLQPRRHVMIEPDLDTFHPILESLAQSRPGYELLSKDIHSIDDWKGLLAEKFPEQSMSNCDTAGALAKNHTLLVLAQPPPSRSKRDHYTPARWLSTFMEECMRQSGLHTFGSVRLLATLPLHDSQALIPRTVADRKRPALLTENVALHAFEVASSKAPTVWVNAKGWDVVTKNASRVAQREAEQHILTPPGRELSPLPMAPESPDPGKMPLPYIPRLNSEYHDRLIDVIRAESPMESNPTPSGKKPTRVNQKRSRAIIQLNQDNRHAFFRHELVSKQAKIDELMKTLSRTAAEETTTSTTLQPILDQIEATKSALAQQTLDTHYESIKQVPVTIDDRRASLHSGNFDDAHLLWDRRPFEPLVIHPEELYPRESERSLVYFEADANAPALQNVNQLSPEERDHPFRLSEAVSRTIGGRGSLSVAELLQLIFPDQEINNIVKAVPSLAMFAAKTPKPEFDSLPKTVHGEPGPDGKLDPAVCYQENLDYDLGDVRVRALSTRTLWDIFVEYQKANMELSTMQLNRLLGGTVTSFGSGDYLLTQKRLH
ncbi:hypothetical protein FE257_000521 [Aspergillus nanangensis]|uniref:rRNA adenine N(6)-methyltransferase n=1 Tax=Aspergillus nanangensis TaxID=2582783 RepID=A0AAD4CUG1_ASPNN|nr:hypothetical protein FE257_000521 [Aspergillus nanangensis]